MRGSVGTGHALKAVQRREFQTMVQAVQVYGFKRSAGHAADLDRVREWTRARFGLGAETTVLVAQVACQLPGCPPLETVVAFWTDDNQRHQFKVFKRVEEVAEDDIPPAWLKSALMVDEDADLDCC